MVHEDLLTKVGCTPVIRIRVDELENVNLYSKLEYYNPTGSVKDRAASYVIEKLFELNEIGRDTTIIESSSGNFGIALSAYCKYHGLKFICVVDPCILPINEMLMRAYGAVVIKVTEADENGGYLLNRIRKVKQLTAEIGDCYWVNQYANPYNADAYYHSLGGEICAEMESLDYLFLGISSGGTITGVSRRMKEHYPAVKVVAVDIIGSVIFGHAPKKRYIPGIGSSMVPKILEKSRIDDVVMIDEAATIHGCHELMEKYNVFAGGSSGSAFAAIKKYFNRNPVDKPVNVLTVFPDRGERYFNTVYNKDWYETFLNKE
jgi:cysteine synthase A